MSRADKSKRRAKRESKARARAVNGPNIREAGRRRVAAAEDARYESLNAERQKWADCAFSGHVVSVFNEPLLLMETDGLLEREQLDSGINRLYCTACGGKWFHITKHP